jgi:hypothetical protein
MAYPSVEREILRLRAQDDTRLKPARSGIHLREATLQERNLLLRGRQTLPLDGNHLFRSP